MESILCVGADVFAVHHAVDDGGFDPFGVVDEQPQGNCPAHRGAADVQAGDAELVEHGEDGVAHFFDGEGVVGERRAAVAGQVGDDDFEAFLQDGDLRRPFFAGHAAAVQEEEFGALAVGLVVHGFFLFSGRICCAGR